MADVLVGAASWTDRSLVKSGWYPKGASSAVLFQFPPWFTLKRANKDYISNAAQFQRLFDEGRRRAA